MSNALPDNHTLLAGMLTQTVGDETTQWVPRADFEALVEERDRYVRALGLLNVAVTCGAGVSARKVLDGVGQTPEVARAMLGVLEAVRALPTTG